MKRVLKYIGLALLGLVVLLGTGLAYLTWKKPDQRPAPAVTIERTPERVARGEYLAKHVVGCAECHTPHRKEAYAYPIFHEKLLQGETFFTREDGFPGLLAAPNLTPDRETGIGAWTDGEVLRAMREGVDREGKALFPMMPYEAFRHLADEDAEAVVAFLRTVPAARNAVPQRVLPFPLPLLIKSGPRPLSEPVVAPPRTDAVAYGRYLTTVAGCLGCHTPVDGQHRAIAGREFAGGQEMALPGKGRVVTANITPHPDTYMGKATREEFIGRFRSFASLNAENAPVAPKGRNTAMPWIAYSGMSDDDLSAIYAFLKTLKPIENRVEPFPDAPGATPAITAAPAPAS
jgi:mono/diheme cytochrome c family protein